MIEIEGTRVPLLAREGALLESKRDANGFLSAAWSQKADLLAIPLERPAPGFLTLNTRIAGKVFRKFATYRMRCALVGDASAVLESSGALRDFVRETNKGDSVWFVADVDQLEAKVAAAQLQSVNLQ